jgi:Zn-dependent metalloprotease
VPRFRRHHPHPAEHASEERSVFTSQHREHLGDVLEITEGGPQSSDQAANAVYENLGATFDFYWQMYRRSSVDGHGLPLAAYVHYGAKYDDAFWDGKQMIFGDGDGVLFKDFTKPLEITAHELTHGVTQYETNLIYWKESGALNESVSDVFGSLVKQRSLNQTAAEADWLLGEGLLADRIKSTTGGPGALRSMKAPGTAYVDPVLGKDPQPAHMAGYIDTMKDNGGVHINSGIPNHAFYLAATNIGGYAWEKAGLIWYKTLTSPYLARGAQFEDFADLTVAVASELFGHSSSEAEAVHDAWSKVFQV